MGWLRAFIKYAIYMNMYVIYCLIKLLISAGWQSLPRYSPDGFPTSMENEPVEHFEKKIMMFALIVKR